MPNEQNIIINLTLDAQKSQEVLKTFKEFNDSFKGLSISLDELDKKGLNTFDKLLNILSSSRTGDATKKIQELSSALKGLFVSAGGVAGVSTAVGGEQREAQMFGASGAFAPPTDYAFRSAVTMGGGAGGGIPVQPVGGAAGGPDQFPGGMTSLLRMMGLGSVSGMMMGGTAALVGLPFVTQQASNFVNFYKTIESISTAAVQDVERRPYREAMGGDITLELLKTRGVGFGAERSKVLEDIKKGQGDLTKQYNEAFEAAINQSGLFSLATLQATFQYRGDALMKAMADYAKQGQEIDIARYGEMGRFAGMEQGLYQPFARTFELYGYGPTKNILRAFQGAGRTQEETLAAQQYAAAAGLGLTDINIRNTALARRFGFSGTAEQATAMFGDPRTTETRDALFNAIGTMMGGPVGGAGTEVFSEVAGKRMMQFMSYGNVQVSQAMAPYTAAAGYIDATGLTPARQAAQQQRVAEYLESQTSRGGIADIAGLKTIFNLGLRNQAQAEYVLDLFRKGRSDDAIKYLRRLGITTTTGELRKAEADILTPMMQAALAPYGDVTQMEVSPLTFATVKGGVGPRREAELVAGATFGVEAETPAQVRERALGPGTQVNLAAFKQVMEAVSAAEQKGINVVEFLVKAYSTMSETLSSQLGTIPSGSPSQFTGAKETRMQKSGLPPGAPKGAKNIEEIIRRR